MEAEMDVMAPHCKQRVLRKPAVKERIGINADSTLYDLMATGHFPRPINLGARAVGWIESEVDAWIETRMAERDNTGLGASNV